jgi:ribosomal protein S18 acetylase RimI-like enzyme
LYRDRIQTGDQNDRQFMIEIKSLSNLELADLVHAFNEAFSDYVIPVHLDEDHLAYKLLTDRIDLSLSAGAFDDGQLIGFIYTGVGDGDGISTAYNAGTGVFPAYRGQRLTERMYDYLIPLFKAKGIQQCLLEVMTDNPAAIHVYEKIGFRKTRMVAGFRGTVEEPSRLLGGAMQVSVIMDLPWTQLSDFWNFPPSWQNDTPGVRKVWDQVLAIGLQNGGELVGYGIKNKASGRVMQFGILPEYRKMGFGRFLFHQLSRVGNPNLMITNIDTRDLTTIKALEAMGLSAFFEQHEMVYSLP